MTVQDAMKALAEALEPNPTYTEEWRYAHLSIGGFWEGRFSTNGVKETERAVDFLHSEDASARLLDAMLDDDQHLRIIKQQNGGVLVWRNDIASFGENRPTAIFLAALAWKGIERPEGL